MSARRRFELSLGRLVELASGAPAPPIVGQLVDASGSGTIGVNGGVAVLLEARLDVNASSGAGSGATFDLTLTNNTVVDLTLGAAAAIGLRLGIGPIDFDASGCVQLASAVNKSLVCPFALPPSNATGACARRLVARRAPTQRRPRPVVQQLGTGAAADE